jgi:hypothetical protein
MATFPSMGDFGATHSRGRKRIRRIYDDGTTRSYKKSNFNHQNLTLSFEDVSLSDMGTINTFFDARQADNADFFVYSPLETSVFDPTGAATLGRHTAIFLDDEITWTQSGKCRYSAQIAFFLKD